MTLDDHKQLRIIIFKKLLLLTTVFMITLVIKNLYYDHPRLYAVEIVMSVFGVIAYLNFDRWAVPSKIDMFTMTFTNIVCCLMLYVLYMEGVDTTAYIWLTAIPTFSYMLNGITKGLILSLVYLLLSTLILSVKVHLTPGYISLDSLLDVVFLIIIVWFLSHFYEKMHRLSHIQLLEMATKDSLTGLNNRHAFYNYFNSHNTTEVGIILIDLDFFKAINDHYGHDAGDFMLVEVANILKKYQTDDIQAFRLGGEEFLMMATDLAYKELCNIANKILKDIRNHQYVHEGCLMELTASMGVQISEETPCNLTHLMKYADYKLYEAKQTGRNRIVSELTEDFNLDKFGIYD